jgi:hypothetical protein
MIEVARLIAQKTCRKNVALPCDGCGFKAGHLADDLPDALFTMQFCVWPNMLPLEKEAHEICRRHRFDFAAQAA